MTFTSFLEVKNTKLMIQPQLLLTNRAALPPSLCSCLCLSENPTKPDPLEAQRLNQSSLCRSLLLHGVGWPACTCATPLWGTADDCGRTGTLIGKRFWERWRYQAATMMQCKDGGGGGGAGGVSIQSCPTNLDSCWFVSVHCCTLTLLFQMFLQPANGNGAALAKPSLRLIAFCF